MLRFKGNVPSYLPLQSSSDLLWLCLFRCLETNIFLSMNKKNERRHTPRLKGLFRRRAISITHFPSKIRISADRGRQEFAFLTQSSSFTFQRDAKPPRVKARLKSLVKIRLSTINHVTDETNSSSPMQGLNVPASHAVRHRNVNVVMLTQTYWARYVSFLLQTILYLER